MQSSAIRQIGVRASLMQADRQVTAEDIAALAPDLVATARFLVGPREADDLVQTTVEKAILALTGLRDPEALRSWLFTILTREAGRLRRRLARFVSLETVSVRPMPDGPSDLDIALRFALLQVPMRMRAAVVLHYMAGLSVEDTARAMGVTTNTAKTQLKRGLERLRKELADEPA